MDNDIEILVKKLIEAREAYYSGKPIISDAEFDSMEDRLKSLSPENDYFDIVGGFEDVDVSHNFPMLSIDNLKYPKPVEMWYRRLKIPNNTELISTPKIDGVSCTLVYINNKFSHAATRGDGKLGKRISFGKRFDVAKHMPLDGIVEVRGELYIPKKYGKTIFKDSPLRNNAAGIIRSGKNFKYLEFIAYQLLTDSNVDQFKKESDTLDLLKNIQFDVAPYTILNSQSELEDEISLYIRKNREIYEYETDGIVVSVNNRELQRNINSIRSVRSFYFHNIAIKPPSKIVKSKLLDVEINVSKSGRLIPVMIYEPVQIDNVTFERVTLNNYEFLKTFGKLYVGNTVTIMRGNEILPVILSVDEDGNKSIPIIIPEDNCPSCNSSLVKDGKHVVCNNLNCPGRNVSQIFNWIYKRNMKNIGIKFLELAYEKGIIKNIIDLYDRNLESKIEVLDGFVSGGGRVSKIMAAIEKSKENVSDIDILSSIGISGIGRSVLENLNLTNIDTLPTNILGKGNYEIRDSGVFAKSDDKISELAVYRYISDWLRIPGNYGMLVKLKKILKSKSYDIDSTSKTVCVTGKFRMSRSDLEKLLKRKGYKVTSHVNKNTEYLVVGEDVGTTKLKKAKDLGSVKIVDIEEIL